MVVELGHRPDRRPGCPDGIVLVYGDGRRDAFDPLYPGSVHTVEELPCIGGKGLEIAALTFGIDGIEGKTRLTRTADTGYHCHFSQGK